ncbi:unnamed protein product [Arctogadus glacialis]
MSSDFAHRLALPGRDSGNLSVRQRPHDTQNDRAREIEERASVSERLDGAGASSVLPPPSRSLEASGNGPDVTVVNNEY